MPDTSIEAACVCLFVIYKTVHENIVVYAYVVSVINLATPIHNSLTNTAVGICTVATRTSITQIREMLSLVATHIGRG